MTQKKTDPELGLERRLNHTAYGLEMLSLNSHQILLKLPGAVCIQL